MYGCEGYMYGDVCEGCEGNTWTCPYNDGCCPICGEKLNSDYINIGGMVGWGPDPPEYVYKITCPRGCLIRDKYNEQMKEITNS